MGGPSVLVAVLYERRLRRRIQRQAAGTDFRQHVLGFERLHRRQGMSRQFGTLAVHGQLGQARRREGSRGQHEALRTRDRLQTIGLLDSLGLQQQRERLVARRVDALAIKHCGHRRRENEHILEEPQLNISHGKSFPRKCRSP